jgi:hypothetical protein
LGERPNTNSNNDVIIDNIIKGIKTINQAIIFIPFWHNMFNPSVNIIMTINFKNAVLYIFLNISIMICVNENIMYIVAGKHKSSII